jgi:hypothetical protein
MDGLEMHRFIYLFIDCFGLVWFGLETEGTTDFCFVHFGSCSFVAQK